MEPWNSSKSSSSTNYSRSRPSTSGGFFDLPKKAQRIEGIDQELSDPKIWDRPHLSKKLAREKKSLQGLVDIGSRLESGLDDIETYFELLADDPDLISELSEHVISFSAFVEETELKTYLNAENDLNCAFLTIHPGAGGTESQDWAEILLRMYLRFAERQKFKTTVVETSPGEEAGIKSATLRIEGDYAYGYLKQEIGVHRLVRISPFDANKRRHTSFAAVFVYPEIDDDIEIDINTEDLRIDTYRSGGAGGQHVNRTDSAVRITHLPTNIVVQCQNERSQHQNKDKAMQMLKSRLYDFEMQKKQKELDTQESNKSDIAWGNQIRSYVLHPYQNIKDHRTDMDIGNTQRVLDGDIIDFIRANLKLKR
jgi:peptide chain release factor 2